MAGRPKLKTHQKIYRRCVKNYASLIIIALVLSSAAMSGFYIGFHANDVNAVKGKDKVKTQQNQTKPILDDRHSRIVNGYMSSMVGECYYDAYQQNESSIAGTANLCDNAMLFLKELCKTKNYDTCNSEFLRKYLVGMAQ